MPIEKYTSNWIENFMILRRTFDRCLQGLPYRIEHVGSTAVPNLDSKPIIDIDIIYSQPADFGEIKWRLEEAGHYHNGNQGIEDRDVFKRNGDAANEILDTIRHHLYFCPINSKALESHILSRDFLRKNDWARLAYQQMKYKLAEEAHQNRKKYADLKELTLNDFIDAILEKEKSERTTKALL